jgi:hypothetical protein
VLAVLGVLAACGRGAKVREDVASFSAEASTLGGWCLLPRLLLQFLIGCDGTATVVTFERVDVGSMTDVKEIS